MFTHPTLPTQTDDPAATRHGEHVRALRKSLDPRDSGESIAVRVLGESDGPALARLAGRDSADVPTGAVLGVEVSRNLVAALSLTDGSSIADPFHPSRPALELLRLRARQLGAPRRGLRRRQRARTRGALAGSPPGAGGRLLQL